MKVDLIPCLTQNHLPRLLQGDRALEDYWSLGWLCWLDERSWSYESRQVRCIFVHPANEGNLYEMLKVAPHSRASWLHTHNCLFWAVLPWFWALYWLRFGKDHLLHPSLRLLSPSSFPGPSSNYIILATQAHSQCFTGYEILSTVTHKCWFCLQFLKIRRKTLPQVLMLSASCHLPILLSTL